jgi:hypothetical protein
VVVLGVDGGTRGRILCTGWVLGRDMKAKAGHGIA